MTYTLNIKTPQKVWEILEGMVRKPKDAAAVAPCP